MSKLYIFGIGGTGSRVLKSLTMLLASGVRINANEIVPIVIDTDVTAGDLTRTIDLMRTYNKVHSQLKQTGNCKNQFFKTRFNLDIVPGVNLQLDNTQNVKFKDFIGLSTMKQNGKEDANYALSTMLFSQKNLDSDMVKGFKGNPNIGSVALNQFQNSTVFQSIISSFQQDDRIFIISSIFGGTGASGFPLLIKNLRAANNSIAGHQYVRDAAIGALSVLPYFSLKPNDKSEIDSSTFFAKTKAALTYYDRNMTEADMMYYIADVKTKQYENNEGGSTQKNDAHFVELAGALSIIDFMNSEIPVLQPGQSRTTVYKEYGIIKDAENIIFSDLSDQTNKLVRKPLTQFFLFAKYLTHQIDSSRKQPWAIDLLFDDNFFQSDFYKSLYATMQSLITWLKELAANKRGFSPFELDEDRKNVFSSVKGVPPAKLPNFNSNYALYDTFLNREAKSLSMDMNVNERFIELFYRATSALTSKKFRMI